MSKHLQIPDFVSDKQFLLGARDFGLDTADAAAECVDNCLDADADQVHITVEENGDYLRMVVEDDGVGIDEAIEEDGTEYDGIAHALAFGRGENKPGTKIGKFGWGLSASATCQSRRTEVYSKTSSEDSFRYTYVDIDEMGEQKDVRPPASIRKKPPSDLSLHGDDQYGDSDEKPESGTVVIFEKMDRASRKTANGLESLLTRELSRVYRHYLDGEKSITVNGNKLAPTDPVYRMEDAHNPGDIPLVEDPYFHERIWVEPPEGGEKKPVDITIAMLDVRAIRTKDEFSKQWANKHGFNQDEQGFYLMRNDREIDGGLSLGLYTKHNGNNYMRGEISFPPELDQYFGIQVNKSRFSLKEGIKDKIQNTIENIPGQIRRRTIEIQDNLRSEAAKEAQETQKTKSERIAKEGDKFLKTRHRLDSDEEEMVEKELEQQKQEEIEELEESDLDEEKKEKEKRRIEQKYQLVRELPFKTQFSTVGEGYFYDPKMFGKQTRVTINDKHSFYDVYEEATSDPEERAILDLLLFSASHAEMLYSGNEHMEQAIEEFRREWSAALKVFLRRWDKESDEMVTEVLND